LKIDSFQSVVHGVDADWITTRDANGNIIQHLAVQHFEGVGDERRNSHAFGYDFGGMFRVAQDVEQGRRQPGALLENGGSDIEGVWTHPRASNMKAASVEFGYTNDPTKRGTCKDSVVRKKFAPYFLATEVAVREVFGLQCILPPIQDC